MSEMSAMREVHAKNSVAWFHQSCINCNIGCCTGKSLDIGMVAVKECFGPINGYLFELVGEFLSSIVSFAGESFGVFVCEDGALSFEDCLRLIIF